jgi:arylsulfatase
MSVVYITVDTVGVPHLGAYGYERATSPHLDRWAKERAVTFDQAYTSGSSTTLVLGSNFRGVYPRRLQWTRVVKTKAGKFLPLAKARNLDGAKVQRTYRLPSADPRPTLPELLRPRGLKSFAVSAVHFVQADANLVGRFDEQIALTGEGSKEPDDDGATAQALKWLGQMGPDDRFFLWVHYLGPHSPSTRKAGITDFGRGLVNEYDHEIAVFDALVAPLLQALSARQDAGEPIAVVLSADHGEEFAQHRYHGHSVEEGTAHIPLFLSLPGVNAHRSPAVVSSVDVLPTVLALTGTPSPGGLDGIDLSALARGGAADSARIVLMDGWVNDTNDGLPFNRVAARGLGRSVRWDLLDFAESARDLPSVRQELEPESNAPALAEVKVAHAAAGKTDTQTRAAEDQRLRAALTRYLEQAPVDPRAAD